MRIDYLRNNIRKKVILKAQQLYLDSNNKRFSTNKIYPEQIQSIYKMAYIELAKNHPQMGWLQEMIKTSSKDIQLKLVLRIPERDIEIDLPDKQAKLGAISHAGGIELLLELEEIVKNLGGVALPEYDKQEDIKYDVE